ncbi:MAG TPA: hypothetical protein DCE23_04380 [Firmicutes bacterium]|nr:hypothetical protein [Bacillota bacterium]
MKIIEKLKGWWHKMFDYNKIAKDFNLDIQTSKDILDAIQEWSKIFNQNEPWINDNTSSLHVARTMCEKVAKAVTIEYKSQCSEPYINKIYQKFLRNKRKNVESMLGKSLIYFKPYYDGRNICISVIQGDKFIPVKFNDDGDLLGCLTIDQIIDGSTIYTRLEYNELVEDKMIIRNIAYKGKTNGVVFERTIPLSSVEKWKDIQPEGEISGVDRLIGGFATMNNVNTIDNSSPCGVPIYHNALDILKEIDKQYSRTLWEFEGTELAIDADSSILLTDAKGKSSIPQRKKRLFRKFDFDETKDKTYNIFSPEIRDNSYFNGLNELLRQAENACHLAYGTLSKLPEMVKTATEIKTSKQDYYVTVSDIQESMQNAFDDLIYGIYVLCKLYNIPVKNNYIVEHDWDDSILIDKEMARNQSLIERNNKITSDVQYVMDTKGYKEQEAIEYVKRQKEYRKITESEKETEIDEE